MTVSLESSLSNLEEKIRDTNARSEVLRQQIFCRLN